MLWHPQWEMSMKTLIHVTCDLIASYWSITTDFWLSKQYSKGLKFTHNLASLRAIFLTPAAQNINLCAVLCISRFSGIASNYLKFEVSSKHKNSKALFCVFTFCHISNLFGLWCFIKFYLQYGLETKHKMSYLHRRKKHQIQRQRWYKRQ